MAGAQGFSINVKSDIDAFIRRIDDVQRNQVPFVTAYALTKTAQDIKDAEIQAMAQVFDRPTRFTLNALYVKPATKTSLTAYVNFKEGFGSIPAWKYLGPEVEGGARSSKSHELRLRRAGILKDGEFVVPGIRAPLDAYGNIPGSAIERILSQLGAAGGTGYLANQTARSKRRNKTSHKYFVMRGVLGVKDGIYQQGTGHTILPVMIFVRQPHYGKRLDFYGIATRVFQQNFARRFREGWARYVTKTAITAKAA